VLTTDSDGRTRLTNICNLTPKLNKCCINISTYFYLKPEYGASEGGSDCGNKISGANLLVAFHSNDVFFLLSFRDYRGMHTAYVAVSNSSES